MRVTNRLLANTVNNNLFKNTEQLLKTQTMISSGKRINKPSDDPTGMSTVLHCRKKIASIDQYSRNIAHGESWLTVTDATLDNVDNLLLRAKELAVYQATETATQQTREITAEEVQNIYDQILHLANTKIGNNHVFAGHQTDVAPFSRDGDFNASYSGDTGEIRTIVGENVNVVVNINGEDAFDNGVNLFDVLRDLKNGLENNSTAEISAQIELLGDAINQTNNVRAEVGARINRLETSENYWATFKLNVEEMLSDTEDVDMTKVMTDLMAQEAVYQASLAASARIIQPSLIDFLR